MKPSDHISKYCTYGEATHSQTAEQLGIPNTPDETQLEAMVYVANEIFDPTREHLAGPLTASSFFRSPSLNKNVHGSSVTSQHMKGEAIDMYKAGRNKKIFDFIRKNLIFDQLIWEYGTSSEPAWVHCSKVKTGHNRRVILQCYLGPAGNPVYKTFDLYPMA